MGMTMGGAPKGGTMIMTMLPLVWSAVTMFSFVLIVPRDAYGRDDARIKYKAEGLSSS